MNRPNMNQPDNVYFIGDACLCWSFGKGIDPLVSAQVIKAYRFLKNKKLPDVLDIVPSYDSLAVHFNPVKTDWEKLGYKISRLISETEIMPFEKNIHTNTIPVVYDGEDLPGLALVKKLSVEEIIQIHTGVTYTVAMIGFRPHFPYLIGLDERIESPRLESPRLRVPAGSVGIGGKQTGIYPEESPGGWILIGRTSPKLLIPIRVGDKINFRSVPEL
jgi:KipI family sensor histidine kinase inhibitor